MIALTLPNIERTLLLAVVLAFVGVYLTGSPELKYVAAGGGLTLLAMEMWWVSTKYWTIYLVGALAISGVLFEALVARSFAGINALPMVAAHVGIALALLRRKLAIRQVWVLFVLCSGYFGCLILRGISPSLAFVEASRNHVSVLMIFVTALLYISYVEAGRRIPLLPAAITLFLSFWAIGRAGIAASLLLFCGVLLFTRRRLGHVLLAGLILTVLLATLVRPPFIALPFVTKPLSLAVDVLQDPRWSILGRYGEALDVNTLLLGFQPSDLERIAPGVQNLHNSFLLLHFRLGVFGVFIAIVIALGLWRACMARSFYSVLLLSIVIRACADTIMLPAGLFDFVLYYLVISSIHGAPDSRLATEAPQLRRALAHHETL